MRILAFDFDNVLRRRWEAAQGKELGEAFRRTLAHVSELRDGWDRVVIACDGGPSFRRLRVKEYKANRSDPGEAYREQRRRTIDRLRTEGCIVIVGPEVEPGGWAEGDDVLAWLAISYTERADEGDQLRIVSDDGDMEALVLDRVAIDVLKPNGKVLNEAAVRARRGVGPLQVYDLKALMGDGSDNYRGFPGIGEKTAAWLINTFGDAVKATTGEHEKLSPRIRDILRQGGPDLAAKGLFLAGPRIDLALDFDALLGPEPQVGAAPETEGESYFEESSGPMIPDLEAPPSPRSRVERLEAPKADPQETLVRPSPEKPVTKGTAMVVREARSAAMTLDPYALQPNSLGALENAARCLFNARVYPQFRNVESIMAAAIEARERGIPIGTALRNAYVVRDRLAWSAAYLAGLVIASGKARIFKIVESTQEHATLRWARADDDDPPEDFVFSFEEARRAGWVETRREDAKAPTKWQTNPRTMLRWAAMREAARAFFPDVVSGMYTPDELRGGHVEDAEFDASDV